MISIIITMAGLEQDFREKDIKNLNMKFCQEKHYLDGHQLV